MNARVLRCGVILLSVSVFLMCVARGQNAAVTGLRLDHMDGSMSVMSDHLARGPVYVAFWATWCVPCVQELRALDRIMRRHPDAGFSVLAVNQDASKGMGKVKAFAAAQGWTFPIVLDPNAQVLQVFNGRTLPFSVLLGHNGQVIRSRSGFLPADEKDIEQEILDAIGRAGGQK
jgi:cytochrome c biogenesis protein CcmG, thiol:disulfide interchange protein DsbE